MIKELVEFGKRLPRAHNALKLEPVSIDLEIDTQGHFVGYITYDRQLVLAEALKSKKGSARVLLDKREEVLGTGDKAESKHQLFLKKLEEYKDLPSLAPVFEFYKDANGCGLQAAQSAFEEIDPKKQTENIAFVVGNTRLCESKEVQDALITRYEAQESTLVQGQNKRCSICGKSDHPIVDRPHGMIKRVPNGQTAGCALVSYNNNAFESYGLRGNENSSICTACARDYVEALNYLLGNGATRLSEPDKKGKTKEIFEYSNRHKISNDTVAIFWTAEPTQEIDLFADMDSPTEASVEALFNAARSARTVATKVVDPNMFYCCTLSSAAARIAIRDWIALSLDQYKQNITRWFEDIAISDWGKMAYAPFYRLIVATRGKATDTAAEGRMGTLLWNAALRCDPLPLSILATVLKRLSTSGSTFTPERAALIKLILNRYNKTQQTMKPNLDPENQSTAYLCGRLFAVVERIQQAAMGYDLNSGVRERFFAAASAMPAATFGRLLTKLTPNHLAKIKQSNAGAGVALSRRLAELSAQIPAFPEHLSLVEQGQFALGYYHQIEEDRVQIQLKKENKDQTNN